MGSNCIDIREYSPKSMDNLFFDNNIWVYLFCPIGNHNKNKQRIYSSFLQSVQQVKATIWINSLVLSEFANVSIKLDYNLWKAEEFPAATNTFNSDYKSAYRKTQRYSDTVMSICTAINQILSFCEKSSDNFNCLNHQSILSSFKNIDFNDSYYLEFCRYSSYTFVTDDKDFRSISKNGMVILCDL